MWPDIDWSVRFTDLITIGLLPLVWQGGRMLLSQRDFNLEVTRILKGEDGKNGVVGLTTKLHRDMYESGGRISHVTHYISNLRLTLMKHSIPTPDPEESKH